MNELIFFIFGCYGVTLLVVQSKIMEPFRMFFKFRVNFIYKLLNCMMCTGFWVGLLSSLAFDYIAAYKLLSSGNVNTHQLILYIIFNSAFISGMVWLIYLIQLNLERYVKDEL